jgi:hypothetical protein
VFDQLVDIAGAIEQRVVGMEMKMGELGHRIEASIDSNRTSIRTPLRNSRT